MCTSDLDRPFNNRGPFDVIQTAQPCIFICDRLPKQAAMLDKFTVMRSVNAHKSNHEPNMTFQTGHREAAPRRNKHGRMYPAIASFVAKHRGANDPGMPAYVGFQRHPWHLAIGGWLGKQYDPFIANQATKLPVYDNAGKDTGRMSGADLFQFPEGISVGRVKNRQQLVQRFDRLRRDIDQRGSLEPVDTYRAKAVDMLDPYRRKTNHVRDNLADGPGNTLCPFVGGRPMISEIVRSKANIDNGAKTRFSDLFHALFLLLCVALIPTVLHLIPLAALGAMLVFTGYRLASPQEFRHVLKVGREQLVIFVATMVAVLATDLLVGIAIGIVVKFGIHIIHGAPIRSLFKPVLDIKQVSENSDLITVLQSAVFSNWIPLKKKIESVCEDERITSLTLDFSDTRVVDHTVMDKLDELQKEFEQHGRALIIEGLVDHQSLSSHPQAARRKAK